MKIKISGEKVLKDFVAKLLQDKKEVDVDVAVLEEEVNDFLMTKVLEALPEERIDSLMEVVEEKELNEKKFDAIIYGAGVDLGAVIKNGLKEFRENYLKGSEVAR